MSGGPPLSLCLLCCLLAACAAPPTSVTQWAFDCLNVSGVPLEESFLETAREEHTAAYQTAFRATARLRGLNPHHYRGFRGPWIENRFIERFSQYPASFFFPIIPLFIQWTDYSRLVHAQDSDLLLEDALRKAVDSRFPYLAVSQHDCGLHQFMTMYPNIIVLSAGGNGHVPIPLLMREFSAPPLAAPRPLGVAFQGTLRYPARKMLVDAVARGGVSVEVRPRGTSYDRLLQEATFSLAPVGCGRTSFRLYEVLQSGSIPVYLYNDVPWLAYAPPLDWSTFALVYSAANVSRAGADLRQLLADRPLLERMQTRARQLVPHYFTYNATLRHIEWLFTNVPRSALRCQPRPPEWCCFGMNLFDRRNAPPAANSRPRRGKPPGKQRSR
eukprot:GGOE01040659.1.p1 GENE.GGOE01040659.1~~GGOE01040659.1.p1  ORF type:complete len:385 (-),score=87.58 GGOE01040659.1:357-1511(-)